MTPQLLIVVDTEEEFDWSAPFSRDSRATTSIPAQAGAHEIYDRFGVVPTYVIDHPVATDPAAVAFLKGLRDAGKVAMVPAHFGWDDVGDFDSLAQLLDAAMTVDSEGPTVLGDSALVRSIDSSGLVVPASGRTIAVIGLEDVVVVDTPDAVLVTSRARAQQVKQMVAGLKASQRDDLT